MKVKNATLCYLLDVFFFVLVVECSLDDCLFVFNIVDGGQVIVSIDHLKRKDTQNTINCSQNTITSSQNHNDCCNIVTFLLP